METLMTSEIERRAYLNSLPPRRAFSQCPKCHAMCPTDELQNHGEVCAHCYEVVYGGR